jgi:6-pyruvoyltetrahydropterin/6-carboxytetrahydropterin synthase
VIARIGKTYSFDAAHLLPDHDGKCAREHGHTYALTIEVEGRIRTEPGPDRGMVLDYGLLDSIYRELLEPRLDHQNLNETIGGECWPTTAENIAAWCFGQVAGALGDLAAIRSVTVKETPKTFATVEAPPLELE